MKIKTCLFYIFIGLQASARWMMPQEADYAIQSQISRVYVHKDGRAEFTTTSRIKVLNESGRTALGTLYFTYRPGSHFLTVKKADILTNGVKTKVSSNYIVDQAIQGSESGFDDLRQVTVSYPQVQVGSEIFVEVQSENLRPYVKNHFAEKFLLGKDSLLQEAEYDIRSEKPLSIEINDPTQALDIQKDKQGNEYRYKIKIKKPVQHQVFDESLILKQERDVTWFIVSTASDYPTYFGELALSYDKKLHESLPAEFQSLVDQVKGDSDNVRKVSRLVATLADQVRYMGDWRQVDGGIIPRSFKTIAETRSGDCKDMAVLTSRLLRELGFQAWPALVYRGDSPPQTSELPSFIYNHAIVYLLLEGRKLWIDPTNFQTYVEGVFEDIANRKALVLNPARVHLEDVEYPPYSSSEEKVTLNTRLTRKGTDFNEMTFYSSGNKALSTTGSMLRYTREQFEESTLSNLTTRNQLLNYKIKIPELKSRIVQPYTIHLTYEEPNQDYESTMGPASSFGAPDLVYDLIKIDSKTRAADVRLGPPNISQSTVEYENTKIRGSKIKKCEATSPWFHYVFEMSTDPVRVIRRMEIKKYSIGVPEVRSAEFVRFQKDLKKCGKSKYIIFERRKSRS